jgi:hypothetical protein
VIPTFSKEMIEVNHFLLKRMPAFIKNELQIIMDVLQPLLKKHSKYLYISIPLMAFSIITLVIRLITGGWYLEGIPGLTIFAFMAALGVALYKESKSVKKDIEKTGMEHIINRINESEHMNDYSKKKYIQAIKSQPKLSFHAFLNFLNEEHQSKERMGN